MGTLQRALESTPVQGDQLLKLADVIVSQCGKLGANATEQHKQEIQEYLRRAKQCLKFINWDVVILIHRMQSGITNNVSSYVNPSCQYRKLKIVLTTEVIWCCYCRSFP